MVMLWDSWAAGLTPEEKEKIEKISYGHAWLNPSRYGYSGRFYFFPRNSGFELGDSPAIPKRLEKKVRLDDFKFGFLEDKTFTSLETVAGMFPEEMEKLWERFKVEIGGKEHLVTEREERRFTEHLT